MQLQPQQKPELMAPIPGGGIQTPMGMQPGMHGMYPGMQGYNPSMAHMAQYYGQPMGMQQGVYPMQQQPVAEPPKTETTKKKKKKGDGAKGKSKIQKKGRKATTSPTTASEPTTTTVPPTTATSGVTQTAPKTNQEQSPPSVEKKQGSTSNLAETVTKPVEIDTPVVKPTTTPVTTGAAEPRPKGLLLELVKKSGSEKSCGGGGSSRGRGGWRREYIECCSYERRN